MTSSSEAASARTAATSACQVVFGGGVDGQVQAEAEQVALAAGEPVGQLAGVVSGGLGIGVVELAAARRPPGGRIPAGRAAGAAARRPPRPGSARCAR